eukprot:3923951-Rhodomonas_salina.1
MSGTGLPYIAYGAISLRASYALSSTGRAYGAISLPRIEVGTTALASYACLRHVRYSPSRCRAISFSQHVAG